MDGKLPCKVVQGVKAFLVFPAAVLHLAVVAWRIGPGELVTDAKLSSGDSNRVGRFRLLMEKRLVNAKPLSVWTHSTRMPLRAYHLQSLFRK